MLYSRQQYIFDKEKIKLPGYLHPVLTRECHETLQNVVDSASVAFHHLKAMEKFRAERYRAMCPRGNLSQYNLHAASVDRLFSWGQDHKPHDPTLAPEPKLSPDFLHFHVDQHAYDEYAKDYTIALESYLSGSYKQWLKVKMWVEHVVSKSTMNPLERKEFFRWWTGTFLTEMAKWEGCIHCLLLPTWEEVVDDVYFAILERVEVGSSAVDEFYINPAAAF